MSVCVKLRHRPVAPGFAAPARAHVRVFAALLVIMTGCGGGGGNSPFVAPSLTITSPPSGATVKAGDTVKISVQATAALQFTRGVVCIGGRGLGATAIDQTPPFDFSLTVPSDLDPGAYNLTALGYGAGTNPLAAASINLQVESASALLALAPAASELSFSAVGEQLPLLIRGHNAGGQLLDLTESSHVLYSSSDEAVGTVSPKGIVTAVGPGTASVKIALVGGGSVAVGVRVMNPALIPSATNIDFGTQTPGTTSASKPMTVTNHVRYPLRILAVNSPLNFPQTNDCLTKSPLPVGGSCVISVSFAPAKTGPVQGIVSILDSAVIARTQVFVTGNGK
jgi:hypothetical protein